LFLAVLDSMRYLYVW